MTTIARRKQRKKNKYQVGVFFISFFASSNFIKLCPLYIFHSLTISFYYASKQSYGKTGICGVARTIRLQLLNERTYFSIIYFHSIQTMFDLRKKEPILMQSNSNMFRCLMFITMIMRWAVLLFFLLFCFPLLYLFGNAPAFSQFSCTIEQKQIISDIAAHRTA